MRCAPRAFLCGVSPAAFIDLSDCFVRRKRKTGCPYPSYIDICTHQIPFVCLLSGASWLPCCNLLKLQPIEFQDREARRVCRFIGGLPTSTGNLIAGAIAITNISNSVFGDVEFARTGLNTKHTLTALQFSAGPAPYTVTYFQVGYFPKAILFHDPVLLFQRAGLFAISIH